MATCCCPAALARTLPLARMSPAIVTVPLAFLVAWAVSAMDRSGRRAASLQGDRQATGGMRA